MYEVVPDYYYEFKCIAEKCKHTCCAGWEIDIDEKSLNRYKNDRLDYICEGEYPHFILDENERCPYLTENNLCRLIIENGEDYLCQICTDHPRFRNYWETITETGLGLCCEAAAELILLRKQPFKLITANGEDIRVVYDSLPEDEQYLWRVRDELLDKALLIEDNMSARLYEYLVFRHLADALYDGMLEERIMFIEKCYDDIVSRWNETDSVYEKLEIARAYSEEYEYDTDFINNYLNSIMT